MGMIIWHIIGDEEAPPSEFSLILSDASMGATSGLARIYLYEGFSDTVSSFFDVTSTATSPVCDISLSDAVNFTGDLITECAGVSDVIRFYDGITDTPNGTWVPSGSSPRGMAVSNGGDILILDVNDLYQYVGLTDSVGSTTSNLDESPSGSVMCVEPETGLLYVGATNSAVIYIYALGNASSIGSVTAAESPVMGICFDDAGNMITCHPGTPGTVYKYAGATSTVTDSFTTLGDTPRGIAWLALP